MKVHVTIQVEGPGLVLHAETVEAATVAEALRMTLLKPSVSMHLKDLSRKGIKAEARLATPEEVAP